MAAVVSILAALAAAAAAPVSTPIEVSGPQAPLKGSLIAPAASSPVVLILPGSGPTDRDGNSPLGVRAAPYRLLAEGLAARGIGSARIDKRGMGESAAAIANGNDVTVQDYVADTRAWVRAVRERTGRNCVWLLGHSEGGLVALAAAQEEPNLCGVVLVSTAGRKLGTVIREQLHANPANAPLFPQIDAAIDALETGKPLDAATLHPGLVPLFGPQIQKYMRSVLGYDPAALAAKLAKPLLIVQGDRDLQVGVADAERLEAADPRARLVILQGVNHVLKTVAAEDRAANLAAYSDPGLPLAPGVVDAVADFVLHGSATP